jgi:hypothetical protein
LGGFGDAQIDTNVVMKFLEEKKMGLKNNLDPVDIEILLKHDFE